MTQANKFIDQYTNKSTTYTHSLKWIIRNVATMDFSKAFTLFNQIENYFIAPEYGFKFREQHDELIYLVSGLFGGYILEKIVVFANGNKSIDIDTINTNSPKGEISLRTLHNRFNSVSRVSTPSTINSLSAIFIPIFSEQLRLQRPLFPDFRRFHRCFGKNKAISDLFLEKFEIDLRKMYLLSFWLFIFINAQYRKGYKFIQFEPEQFVAYATAAGSIDEKDVLIFLEAISTSRVDYIAKYHELRTNQSGKHYDYNYQEYFDRALPRISYSYPLLRHDGKYLLISLASYYQFLKMDRFYRMITMEISEDFKSKYVGPAIEEYVKYIANEFKNANPELNPRVYGNEKYKVDGKKKDEPDVILETDEFVLFIECKANAFGLGFLKDFDQKNFDKTLTAVTTSVENITRYIGLHKERLSGKTIFRFLVFYEGMSDWFAMLEEDIEKHIPEHNMTVLGIDTLEVLLKKRADSLPTIIESFRQNDPQYEQKYLLTEIDTEDHFILAMAKELEISGF